MLTVVVVISLIGLVDFVYGATDGAMQERFSEVYAQRVWERRGGKFNGNGSGPGSDQARTVEVRECLLSIIKRFNISSMLDAACGSFNWQPLFLGEVEQQRPNFRYHGVDIVPSVVESNARRWNAAKTNWRFDVADMSTASSPWSEAYDLILVRDVLFHLTYDKIMCALNNFSRSKSRLLFTTTFPSVDNFNRPVSHRVQPIRGRQLNEGGYRSVNLQGAPLLLPEPLELCSETVGKRAIGLWRLPLSQYKFDANDRPLIC